MILRLFRCVCPLLLLLLSACSLLQRPADTPGTDSAPAPTLSEALRAAEAELAAQPKDGVLIEKVAKLRQQASSIETEQLGKAEKLWAGQQPGAAIQALDAGLIQLPDSAVLQRRRTYYAELLDRRLELPKAELRLVRGRYVADALRVERQIHTLAPGSNAATLAALEQERQALAAEVQALGQRALDRKLYGFARWAFNIAGDLGASDAAKLLAETTAKEKQKGKKAPAPIAEPELSEQQVLESRRSQLKQQLQDSLNKRDLTAARQQLTELRKLFPAEPELPRYEQTLKPLAKEQVQVLQADGNRRYRDGDIAGALAAWRQALLLDPENRELPPQIDRAQKVQANLNSLRDAKRPR